MNIAVTGASGFIGRYTVDYFNKKGYKVLALGRDIIKLNSEFNDSVIKIETDYSYEHLTKTFKDTHAIVHLAAKRLQRNEDPLLIEPYINDNILLTQNILKASQGSGVSKVCQSSTIGVYSNSNPVPFSESQVPAPISIYGVSKLTCENLGSFFSTKTGLKVFNLRLASLCGIGEKEGVVFTDYLSLARQKKKLEIWGKGETYIDFIYVKDVVLAIDKALNSTSDGGTYNIGSGTGYSIKQLAENINNTFNNQGNIDYLPDKKEGRYRVYMDIQKAAKELNWKPEWDLISALADMKKIVNGSGRDY